MDYNQIASFLENFKKTLLKSEHSTKIISEIITKHIASEISPDMVKIKSNIIYIQSSPIVRSEVLIHKQGILSDLTDLLKDTKFIDIR